MVFFDDILIYSKSVTAHVDNVKAMFQFMKKNQLYVKMSKCAFGVAKLNTFGILPVLRVYLQTQGRLLWYESGLHIWMLNS